MQKLLALQLTDKAAIETLRARLSLALPPERLRDILPDSPNAPVMGLPRVLAGCSPTCRSAPVVQAAARARSTRCRGPGSPARRTPSPRWGGAPAGGAPLLATDPHLGLSAPSIWMLARMDLAEGR